MDKRLSHDKIIKRLHNLTPLLYKDCRARLKKDNWDLHWALFHYYGVSGK